MNKEIHKAKNSDIIYPLYHIIHRGATGDHILEWIGLNGDNYSNKQIKNTLRKAGREDFIKMIIKEEDIEINDSIKSRMTSRVGKVIGIHADGDTIEVKWDEGGRQFLSKESVFKLSGEDIQNPSDLTTVKTVSDPYADMNAKDKSISNEVRENEKLAGADNEIDTTYNLLFNALREASTVYHYINSEYNEDTIRIGSEQLEYINTHLNNIISSIDGYFNSGLDKNYE